MGNSLLRAVEGAFASVKDVCPIPADTGKQRGGIEIDLVRNPHALTEL